MHTLRDGLEIASGYFNRVEYVDGQLSMGDSIESCGNG